MEFSLKTVNNKKYFVYCTFVLFLLSLSTINSISSWNPFLIHLYSIYTSTFETASQLIISKDRQHIYQREKYILSTSISYWESRETFGYIFRFGKIPLNFSCPFFLYRHCYQSYMTDYASFTNFLFFFINCRSAEIRPTSYDTKIRFLKVLYICIALKLTKRMSLLA